jgi:hypothetical protein
MSFWWPVTEMAVEVPYWWYVVTLVVIIAIGPIRRRHVNEAENRLDVERTEQVPGLRS